MGPLYFCTIQNALKNNEIIFTKINDETVAFLQWKAYKKEETYLLNKMAVRNDFIGKHIGSEILKRFQDIAKLNSKNIKLRVAKINDKTISFYEKHGFAIIDDKYSSDIVHTMFWSCK